MTIFSLDFWLAIHPVIILSAALPPLMVLIIWGVFYSGYGAKVGRLTLSLKKAVDAGDGLEDCSLVNLDTIEPVIMSDTDSVLAASWKRMRNQIAHQYTEGIIPEARAFFDDEALIGIQGGRKLVGGLHGGVLTLALLSLLMPIASAYAINGAILSEGIFLGVCSGMLIGIIHLIFVLMDQSAYNKAQISLYRFYDTFDTVLPVAGSLAGPALLLQATRESRKAFEEATARMTAKIEESAVLTTAKMTESVGLMATKVEEATAKISDKFDEFTQGGVLPALIDAVQAITDQHIVPALSEFKTLSDQTMAKVIERQDTGMAELTSSFATRLSDTLEVRMTALSGTLGDLTAQMTTMAIQSDDQMKSFGLQYTALMEAVTKGLNDQMTAMTAQLSTNVSQQSEMMAEQISQQAGMMAEQKETLKQSSGILLRAAELQGQASDSSDLLNAHVGLMSETMSKFQIQTDHFITEIMDFSVKNSVSQLKMSEDINAAQLKLEESLESSMEKHAEMSELISGMMTDITERMNEAMAGAGREIALGINRVTADNAEAISELTIQAQKLREDYTSYFDRTEESSRSMMEDLDYQMHGLMATMTEGIGTLLKDTVQENAETLSQYKNQTLNLLQSFEEQSQSIGLYAKEINLDISELTTGIKSAIADFTINIQEGVKLTIGEFDQGLAELTDRIANTVESISEAVENIPKALNRK